MMRPSSASFRLSGRQRSELHRVEQRVLMTKVKHMHLATVIGGDGQLIFIRVQG